MLGCAEQVLQFAEPGLACVQDMRLAWEEPFGPVVPVVRVKTVEEAVDHCNANNLALQVQLTPSGIALQPLYLYVR